MTEPNYAKLEKAVGANALLENKAFQDAYALVRGTLLASLEALPIGHPESSRAAEDFRMSLKLLGSLKTALEATVKSGKVEQSLITEIESYRKNPRKGLFNRA
jgi:hypothetical protein